MNKENHYIPPLLEIQVEVQVVIFSLRDRCLQVLLVPDNTKQPNHWSLPSNFITPDYSLDESACDIMYNYTGVQETYQEQLYTYSDIGFSENYKSISIIYFAIIPADITPGMDCKRRNSRWFPLDSLPDLEPDYPEIIAYAFRRLRYKLEYTAVGFELLPENFSLSELQRTYEIVLGERLDKRNFRRRILEAGIIEPTPHQRVGEGRPARLYRYRLDAVAEVKARRLFP